MFCSNCGTNVKPELNYCNRCGARVAKGDMEEQKSLTENLTASLGYIGGFGLIGYIFVALILVKSNVPEKALIMISFFYLAALFGICYLILQQLKSAPKETLSQNADFQNDFHTGQLEAATTAQLEEAKQQPISSVTENTTRMLEKSESKI